MIHPIYDLQRDEYLHIDQGLHLAWGYISVPPMTSWISVLIHCLGGSVFWVKFFPALFGALTLMLVWKMIEKLNGSLYACILGTLALLLSPLLRINTLYQPNSFDIFFWTLAFYVLVRWIQTAENRWVYIAAIAIAFGFYTKYNILILVAALIPALLLTPYRTIFVNKQLYIAILGGFLLILPNLYWQFHHGFPTLHQLQELTDTQLVNVNRLDFLKDQGLYFINSLFIIIAAFIGFSIYPPFRKYRVVALTYLFALGLFLLFRAKSYYAIGLYPILLAFGAVYISDVTKISRSNYLRPMALVLILVLFIPFMMIGFPNKSPEKIKLQLELYRKVGMLRWEDGKEHHLPQDYADMLGWRELAEKVDSAYDPIFNKEETLVLCDNYGQAGAINYYSHHKNINAVSFNADYINWFPLDKPIRNVIRIIEVDEVNQEIEDLSPIFGTVTQCGSVDNVGAREFGTSIVLFQNANTDINQLIAKEIKALKEGRIIH
ncbi:MAG: glycosyltransferase family 39 protein [Saprospiraceae bacterium]|nr:glycosyltransferase family 39 protein [Saprospiraceae bacterium]